MKLKALVLGATGLVGDHLLKILISDQDFEKVTTITRKELPTPYLGNPKIQSLIGDLDKIEDLAGSTDAFHCDVLFCCLGTTMKVAGSKEAFRRVDFDYPLLAGKLLKKYSPQAQYLIVSALGADSSSSIFYYQVKGEIEQELTQLDFPKLTILRPSLILGERDLKRGETRPGEKLAQMVFKAIDPIFKYISPTYAGVEANKIAQMLTLKAKKDFKGKMVVNSDEIKLL